MGKTTDLRKAIKAELDLTQGATYYRRAPADATMPYKVFDLRTINLGDTSRDDISLDVDIWDLSKDPKSVEDIADAIESLLNGLNLPQATVLPTFYRETRAMVDDPDKNIQHILLTFTVQNYENI